MLERVLVGLSTATRGPLKFKSLTAPTDSEKLMQICLDCGYVSLEKSKFCKKCGSPILLLERYRPCRILGKGGFGTTYLAQDEAKPSKPRCVIKKFVYFGFDKDKASQLFEQEAILLENLGKHPQIPELYAYAHFDGQQFLVQEFIDGSNLDQELKKDGKFDEAKIRKLLLDVLPILDFIHTNKVIHRDIKPANILRCCTDNKLVLVDFGIAKQSPLPALHNTGTFIGSIDYSAPEQLRGKAVYASDLYSLGVTCLHLLTGVKPSDLRNANEQWVWRDFLGGKTVSTELEGVLERMLMPVAERFGSASEISQALCPAPPHRSLEVSPSHRPLSAKTLAQPRLRSPFPISRITGIDYRELDYALRNRQWQKADELTRTFMLKAMGKDRYLNEHQVCRFPGEDLKIIDRLWSEHSNGKLGFGVQKRIWHECNMPGADYTSYKAAWLDFGRRVNWQGGSGYDGWKYFEELDMTNPQAYPGHLPCCNFNWGGAICWIERELVSLLSRKEVWIR